MDNELSVICLIMADSQISNIIQMRVQNLIIHIYFWGIVWNPAWCEDTVFKLISSHRARACIRLTHSATLITAYLEDKSCDIVYIVYFFYYCQQI